MKKDRKTQAQMLILPTRAALNVAVSTVWDKYDAPAWKRAGKPDPMRKRVPALLQRQFK